jgi:hypothetical protein
MQDALSKGRETLLQLMHQVAAAGKRDMTEVMYKGFLIRTRRTDEWAALIWRPESKLVMSRAPTATLQEGEKVAISRAEALIDETIAQEAKSKFELGD